MNIYTYLKKDHEKVEMLFEDIIEASSYPKREQLFNQLKEELLVHAKSEHNTFYKTLKKYEDLKELIKHADKEHAEIENYLEQLSSLSSKEAKWLVLLGELKYSVQHHVKEEEGNIFSHAKKVLSKEDAQVLVEQMEKAKEKISQRE